MRGIFVSYRDFLKGGGGGVQICTREYVDAIEAAGIGLTPCPFDGDRRLSTRIGRRLTSSPYFRPAEPGLVDRLANMSADTAPDVIFLNQVALAVYAPQIKARIPNARLVLLSHGLESTDLLHLVRLRKTLPLSGRIRPNATVALGSALADESGARTHVDLVFALSPFDADLERWIGARRVTFLPRIVTPAPLAWRPTGQRVGFLGTLDHAPNLEGLVRVLEALDAIDAGGCKVRVIGGSPSIGRWLAARFPRVDYLGPLADDEVCAEAATWNAFLHPIFCQARGCSTKLATAIAWEIPIVTTTQGYRGYEWRSGELTVADEPRLFAEQVVRLLDPEAARAARSGVSSVARTSPVLAEIASRIAASLEAEAALRVGIAPGGDRLGDMPCAGS